MRVAIRGSDYYSVDSVNSTLEKTIQKFRPFIGGLLMRLQNSSNPVLHSPAFLPSLLPRELNHADDDVINLHWFGGEYLSIKDICAIRKPLVWTLHDMWAFCGAEHYAPDDESARWRHGYTKGNRPSDHRGLDIDRWTWERKNKTWKSPIHIIAPSQWLADCAKNSVLMRSWPVSVIPNPLNTNVFKPLSKSLAREILGLPIDEKLVLFGAIGGGTDPRKGWDLLKTALVQLSKQAKNVHAVIFGQSKPRESLDLGLNLHWMGHLSDDTSLALLYSAADVMVVPSRQENLPQSATEAQACGCPVVAFNCTGLPDAVEHGVTGYLAEPYVIEDLVEGISWVLAGAARHKALSDAARDRALKLWAIDVVIPQYLEVYRMAMEAKS